MHIGPLVVLSLIVVVLFAFGFYYAQKRFWRQDNDRSHATPPSPPEGQNNEKDDTNPVWRTPRDAA